MGIQQWRLRPDSSVSTSTEVDFGGSSELAALQSSVDTAKDGELESNNQNRQVVAVHEHQGREVDKASSFNDCDHGAGLAEKKEELETRESGSTAPLSPTSAMPRPMPAPVLPSNLAPKVERVEVQNSNITGSIIGVADRSSSSIVNGSIDQLDWQGLQAIINQGSHCQTCDSSKSILGGGDALADWMFISDAPSQADLHEHGVFSGRAGKLYEDMLLAVGLDRSLVYTTSVFKCVVPVDRSLSPNCDNLLQRQIALVQPKIIVVFGEFAAQSVLRSNESFETLRAQDNIFYQTQTPVVASYSPIQLLENVELKAGAWQDLKKCLAIVGK